MLIYMIMNFKILFWSKNVGYNRLTLLDKGKDRNVHKLKKHLTFSIFYLTGKSDLSKRLSFKNKK